jgi:hypothetical protein
VLNPTLTLHKTNLAIRTRADTQTRNRTTKTAYIDPSGDTHACTCKSQPLCYTAYVLCCCTCTARNYHDKNRTTASIQARELRGPVGVKNLASVVQEGSFLRFFLFPRGVHVVFLSKLASNIVAMRHTWCCRRRRRCGCWRLCLLLLTPDLNWAARRV